LFRVHKRLSVPKVKKKKEKEEEKKGLSVPKVQKKGKIILEHSFKSNIDIACDSSVQTHSHQKCNPAIAFPTCATRAISFIPHHPI
jgi:hypothetical protein